MVHVMHQQVESNRLGENDCGPTPVLGKLDIIRLIVATAGFAPTFWSERAPGEVGRSTLRVEEMEEGVRSEEDRSRGGRNMRSR